VSSKIVLNEYGESFIGRYFEETELLDDMIGYHEVCGGSMNIIPASPAFNALVCRRCGLRIMVPNRIRTFRELRLYFDKSSYSAKLLEAS